MPVLGIGSSSPPWTPEPQCGVPVHILKRHDCVLLTRSCLFLSSSSSPAPPPPLTSVLLTSFSIFFPFSCLLHHLTGVFLVNAVASRWVRLGWLPSTATLPPLTSPLSADIASRLHCLGRRWTRHHLSSSCSYCHRCLDLCKLNISSARKGEAPTERLFILQSVRERVLRCSASKIVVWKLHRAFACGKERLAQWILTFSSRRALVYVCVRWWNSSARQCRQTSISADCRWDGVFTDTGSISYTCSSMSLLLVWCFAAGLYQAGFPADTWSFLVCLISHCQILFSIFGWGNLAEFNTDRFVFKFPPETFCKRQLWN